MFTGIVTDVGSVKSIEGEGDLRFEIVTSYDTSSIDIGASICCSGACMTVIETGDDWFAVQVSPESLSKTTLSDWVVGTTMNLERSLRMGDEMGGHIVTGHVDGVGTVKSVTPVAESWIVAFEAPQKLAQFIAPKGSITIDGVSLTVNRVEGAVFEINIIPHTQQVTTLGKLAPGTRVNLEIDVLARYVVRLKEVNG